MKHSMRGSLGSQKKNMCASQAQQGKMRSNTGLPRRNRRFRYRSQPPVTVCDLSLGDSEILPLDSQRHRTGLSFTHVDAVHAPDRCDLSRGAGEEQFVRDVQEFTRLDLLAHIDAKVARD